MSFWRRKALETFPELRKEISEAKDAYGVAFAIRDAVIDVYHHQPLYDEFLTCAYEYAWWLFNHTETGTDAALCCFYGGIIRHEAVRQDIGRWLTREQFYAVSGEFEYRLGTEYDALEQAFLVAIGPPRRQKQTGHIG